MGRYDSAKGVLGFLAFIGWCGVGLAVVAFVGVMTQRTGGALPAAIAIAPVLFASLLLVAFAQMGRAQIDVAETTAQMLDELRQQGRQRAATRRSIATGPTRPASSGIGLVKVYKNKGIYRRDDGMAEVDGEVFANVIEAERFIDGRA